MRFKNKVIIVTGGASGIGLAAARMFAREGAIVAVNDLKAAAVREVLETISQEGGAGVDLSGDVTDAGFAAACVTRLMSAYGRVDVLVNNAGIATSQPAEFYTNWRKIHAVNLDAPFYWSQIVAREAMIGAKQGAIVNIASVAGLSAYPGDVGYIASKHGLVGLTKALALEWVGHGIRVNCLCPGFTETQLIKDVEAVDPARFSGRRERVPMGRSGTADEQAKVIVFLASDDASFMTGVAINNDGGQMAMSSGWAPRIDRTT